MLNMQLCKFAAPMGNITKRELQGQGIEEDNARPH